MSVSRHEVLAGAAVKKFLDLLEAAPKCGCGDSCEVRKYLLRQIRSKNLRADRLFADLFDESLPRAYLHNEF